MYPNCLFFNYIEIMRSPGACFREREQRKGSFLAGPVTKGFLPKGLRPCGSWLGREESAGVNEGADPYGSAFRLHPQLSRRNKNSVFTFSGTPSTSSTG